ncbi:MAG TPA: hypothetical protein VHF89_00605 [Solirubrobacteraceae bacterium]|nr:hypothetical protein [Solirubrobacteraceae bacterium]
MDEIYAPFIGSWDVESSVAGRGEWHFERVLGGLGVQDVIFPAGAPPEQHGITLRAYDERLGLWRAFFVSPGDGEFVQLVARRDGDRIVQEGHDLGRPERRLRWSFSEIEPEAFLWRGEASEDDGETWRLTHEMRARRR